jgi:hypothetical protein
MDIMHWPNSHWLSLSISKRLFIQISNYDLYMVNTLKKKPMCEMKIWTSSYGSQSWFKLCGITCEINVTNFINCKNHFNFFWSIFLLVLVNN